MARKDKKESNTIITGKEGIKENSVFTMEKNEVEYILKSVNFTRFEKMGYEMNE